MYHNNLFRKDFILAEKFVLIPLVPLVTILLVLVVCNEYLPKLVAK
jgi:hypothetical protein